MVQKYKARVPPNVYGADIKTDNVIPKWCFVGATKTFTFFVYICHYLTFNSMGIASELTTIVVS